MATLVGDLFKIGSIRDADDSDRAYFERPNRVATVTTEEGTFLYTTSLQDLRLQAFAVNPDGSLTALLGDVGTSYEIGSATDLLAIETATGHYLAAGSSSRDELTLFEVQDDGTVAVSDVVDAAALSLHDPDDFVVVERGERSFLFVCSTLDDRIAGFEIEADGTLTKVADVTGAGAPRFLDEVHDLATFELDGKSYLAAVSSGAGDNALSVFSVGPAGRLSLADVRENVREEDAYAYGSIAAAVVDGAPFLYATSDTYSMVTFDPQTLSDGSISLGGPLTFTDQASAHRAGWDQFEIRGNEKLVTFSGDGVGFSLFDLSRDPEDLAVNRTRYEEPMRDVPYQSADGVKVEVDGTAFYYVLSTNNYGLDGIFAYEIGGGEDLIDGTREADTLIGLGARDVLHGRRGADVLDGGPGADILIGGTGRDSADYGLADGGVTVDLSGGKGRGSDAEGDLLFDIEELSGSGFADRLKGNGQANGLIGGAGDDLLVGRGGGDILFGETGADTLAAGRGNDRADGGAGHDTVDGGGGKDTLFGQAGADQINGGAGRDKLDGGGGSDVLIGSKGADILRGGDGADRFVFQADDGVDTIEDFEIGVDVIDFSGHADATDFASLDLGQTIAGAVITFSVTTTITLLGIRATDLSDEDFLF